MPKNRFIKKGFMAGRYTGRRVGERGVMSGDNSVAPIIIKRKKVVAGGGHHGGSWKVAYADFVTAMMAFFMLMWLLSATTEVQRSGIADYFSPTIAIARTSGGGDGLFGGDSVMTDESRQDTGSGATNERPSESNAARGSMVAASEAQKDADREAEDAAFRAMEEMLKATGGESLVADPIRQHITTRVTDEGLVVELFETAPDQLFDVDGVPTLLLQALLAEVADAARLVTNPVAIEAHTATFPIVRDGNPEWDISRARAEAAHDLATGLGLDSARVNRVTAHADREPVSGNPMSVRNNRIEVVFLRQ
jgi:chemotaxis protein MotB